MEGEERRSAFPGGTEEGPSTFPRPRMAGLPRVLFGIGIGIFGRMVELS
jgi:hypothetical protein